MHRSSDNSASTELQGAIELLNTITEPRPETLDELHHSQPGWRDRLARGFYFLLALAFACGIFYVCWCYWVPAHQGVDQNGYLVGGKQLAATGTMKFAPRQVGTGEFDPHQFVGRMWVGADLQLPQERYYPKYPIGFPAMIAIALKAGGVKAVYWINPVCTALAVFGAYLLGRAFLKPWYALIAAMLFATSPTFMFYSTNPNSHSSAVCFVTWGFYFLFRYWQVGGFSRAIVAGLCLGMAATIRYTEGMLLLPLMIVVLYSLRSHGWKQSLTVFASWLVPVAALVIYNKSAMGTWTGYDDTNESTGFKFEYFLDNWETTLRHMGTVAVFYFFPISIAGLIWMLQKSWKAGLIFASWIVPCLLLYTFYYWAPDYSYTGYTRFYTTILPACSVLAMWLVQQIVESVGRVWMPRLAAGVVAAMALSVNAKNTAAMLEPDQTNRLNLLTNSQMVVKHIPDGSVVFSPEESFLCHLHLVTNDILYTGQTFNASYIAGLPNAAPADEPQGLQPGRRDALFARLKDLNQKQLDDAAQKLMLDAIDQHKRVFYVVSMRQNDRWLTLTPEEREKRIPDPVRKWNNKELKVEPLQGWEVYLPPAEIPNKPRGRRIEPRPDPRPTIWYQIFEIEKRPAPATRPTPRPAK